MKKTLIVVVVVVVTVVALGIPALIGSLIHGQGAQPLAEALPDAEIRWDRGWFRSSLDIVDQDLRANFDFGHASLSPPGWLSVDGRAILGALGATVDVSGRIGPMLDTRLVASAPDLTVPGTVTWRYARPAVELSVGNDRMDLQGNADTLRIDDVLGNELILSEAGLKGTVVESSGLDIEIRIELAARRAGFAPSRASIVFERVDAPALEQLLQSLGELSSSEPGSATAGLAAIGLASAWQQLGERGLVVSLESLELDGNLQAGGRWTPGERELQIEGEGARDALLAWWSRIDGLIRQVPPSAARGAAADALDEFERSGQIRRSGERIFVSLDSTLINGTPSPSG